jgi:hypothetical protein
MDLLIHNLFSLLRRKTFESETGVKPSAGEIYSDVKLQKNCPGLVLRLYHGRSQRNFLVVGALLAKNQIWMDFALGSTQSRNVKRNSPWFILEEGA